MLLKESINSMRGIQSGVGIKSQGLSVIDNAAAAPSIGRTKHQRPSPSTISQNDILSSTSFNYGIQRLDVTGIKHQRHLSIMIYQCETGVTDAIGSRKYLAGSCSMLHIFGLGIQMSKPLRMLRTNFYHSIFRVELCGAYNTTRKGLLQTADSKPTSTFLESNNFIWTRTWCFQCLGPSVSCLWGVTAAPSDIQALSTTRDLARYETATR